MAPEETTFPARLHVLLARESPAAVVIRRGPSRHVGTFLWDRATDRVTPGQWLKGRIYERRADLSPDGRHMIYFAMNGHWQNPVSRGSWTAVSRAPWLKAVSFYPKGDCWQGGGLFLDRRRFWLNDGPPRGQQGWEDRRLIRTHGPPPEGARGGECLGVYFPRLLRDGWRWAEESDGRTGSSPWEVCFDRDLPRGWTLMKSAHASIDRPIGRGVYYDTHALVRPDGELFLHDDWDWAERDGADIVYTSEGKLFRQRVLSPRELGPVKRIHDFNAERFTQRSAPY